MPNVIQLEDVRYEIQFNHKELKKYEERLEHMAISTKWIDSFYNPKMIINFDNGFELQLKIDEKGLFDEAITKFKSKELEQFYHCCFYDMRILGWQSEEAFFSWIRKISKL